MTSIITGDIINSRRINDPREWLTPLKRLFSTYGKSPKSWEIYRGDSFQLQVDPLVSFMAAVRIKARIKSLSEEMDVRMAIGVGSIKYIAPKITESNGEAFIYSGEQFEDLKKLKKSLTIKTPWPQVDAELNIVIGLTSIIMDQWSASSAEIVDLSLSHEGILQKELAKKLGRTQSSVSERQKRAQFDEIIKVEAFYRNKIRQQLTEK